MNIENKQRIIGIVVLISFIAILIFVLCTSSSIIARQEIITTQSFDNSSQNIVDTSSASTEIDTIEKNSVNSIQNYLLTNKQQTKSNLTTNNVKNYSSINKKSFHDIYTTGNNIKKSTIKPQKSKTKSNLLDIPIKNSKIIIKNKTNAHSINSFNKKRKATFWSVQVGSFSNPLLLQNMVSKLQISNYSVYLQKIKTMRKPIVRVLVGKENDKNNAFKIARQLKQKLNIDCKIIGFKI